MKRRYTTSILLSLGILFVIFVMPSLVEVNAWHEKNWNAENSSRSLSLSNVFTSEGYIIM